MMNLTLALNWAATYLVHSTLLLLLAWTASRLLRDRRIALQETLWRGALFGALVTASLQVGAPALDLFDAAPATPAETALLVEESAALSATPLAEAGAQPTDETVAVSGSPLALPGWAFVSVSVLWALGALWGLARLALAARRLSGRVRRAQRLATGPLATFLDRISRSMKLRSPRLLVSKTLNAPFAAGIRQPSIVVPTDALERLDEAEQQGLVAHEAAHLSRRDPAWLLAALVMERVFFFQPLNRLARARLQDAAELLADEQAALHAGGHQELARCLVEVAGWRSQLVESAPVVGAASGPRALTRRVERLLAGRRDAGRGAAWPITLALLAAVALVPSVSWSLAQDAPEAPEPPPAPAPTVAVVPPSEPAPPVPNAPLAVVDAENRVNKEKLEKLAQEHKLRTQELMMRERELRQRLEMLEARARQKEDEASVRQIAELKAELESLRALQQEQRAHFMAQAEELGARVVVRERAREAARARRAERAAREAYVGSLARAPRAPRPAESLDAERARLEAEIQVLREREERLMERLQQLEAKEKQKGQHQKEPEPTQER